MKSLIELEMLRIEASIIEIEKNELTTKSDESLLSLKAKLDKLIEELENIEDFFYP